MTFASHTMREFKYLLSSLASCATLPWQSIHKYQHAWPTNHSHKANKPPHQKKRQFMGDSQAMWSQEPGFMNYEPGPVCDKFQFINWFVSIPKWNNQFHLCLESLWSKCIQKMVKSFHSLCIQSMLNFLAPVEPAFCNNFPITVQAFSIFLL